jgi:hypothetical protein
MPKPFVPSSHMLMAMIRAAEAKADAARERALVDRFERAVAINARAIREERAADCRRHMYVGDSL